MLTKAELEFYEHSTGALLQLASDVSKICEAVEKCIGHTVTPVKEAPVKEEHPNDSPFDCLAVTSVQVFLFKDGVNMGHMKGIASVVINDQIQLRGLRVMDGDRGLYVAYPPDMFGHDESETAYNPITRQLKEHIENCVLQKYEEITK